MTGKAEAWWGQERRGEGEEREYVCSASITTQQNTSTHNIYLLWNLHYWRGESVQRPPDLTHMLQVTAVTSAGLTTRNLLPASSQPSTSAHHHGIQYTNSLPSQVMVWCGVTLSQHPKWTKNRFSLFLLLDWNHIKNKSESFSSINFSLLCFLYFTSLSNQYTTVV